MAAVKELLRAEADGALGFGDYTLSSKTKLDGFEFQGDYKVGKEWYVRIRIRSGNSSRRF